MCVCVCNSFTRVLPMLHAPHLNITRVWFVLYYLLLINTAIYSYIAKDYRPVSSIVKMFRLCTQTKPLFSKQQQKSIAKFILWSKIPFMHSDCLFFSHRVFSLKPTAFYRLIKTNLPQQNMNLMKRHGFSFNFLLIWFLVWDFCFFFGKI